MEVKFKKKKNVSKIQAEGILLRDVPDETKWLSHLNRMESKSLQFDLHNKPKEYREFIKNVY